MKRAIVLPAMLAILVLALTFWVFIPSGALAAVPKLINFQGILKDGSGNPVANSSYSVTFRIYDAPAGGNLLWSETQSVTTTSGLFAVLLGATTPVPDTAFKGTDRYLGLTVSPDPEMALRQRLVSVGYSYRVNSVDSASGGTITSKVSIGPGHTNTGTDAFVAGANNRARGAYSVVGGGGGTFFGPADSNSALGDYSTVGGGRRNTASDGYATVGGGSSNNASGTAATVGGGGGNTASGGDATVGGGNSNTASGDSATAGGGAHNTASFNSATVSGGNGNTAGGIQATVGGGLINTASADYATVGGGRNNTASFNGAAVGGGFSNSASGVQATVGGGRNDTASGLYATVPGGNGNRASGDYSLAAGRQAKASHNGAFVWADNSSGFDFVSTAINQFLIRAKGGVGIGTTSPHKALDIQDGLGIGGAGGNMHVGGYAANADDKLIHFGDTTGSGLGFVYIGERGADDRLELAAANIYLNPSSGGVGIGTTTPAALLHVNGSAGNGTGIWSTVSDRRLKRDIEPIQNALETVNQLQPVSFRWKDAKKDAEYGRVRGLIAQDVEKVIPEWVKTDPDGYKRLEPIGVDALLIEAIKELKTENESLKDINKDLGAEMKELKALVQKLLAKKEGAGQTYTLNKGSK